VRLISPVCRFGSIQIPSEDHELRVRELQRLAQRKVNGDAKVANRNVRDFGWEIAHAAVSRRPPISLYTMVPRTEGYAYDVGVWDLSIVQGPFSVAPCQTLA
jgi:hypothetical protein